MWVSITQQLSSWQTWVGIVGVVYLSIAPYNENEAPHKILLEKEVVLWKALIYPKFQKVIMTCIVYPCC